MEGLYLYCIREKTEGVPAIPIKGIDGKGEVFTIVYREVEAVVSNISLEEFASEEEVSEAVVSTIEPQEQDLKTIPETTVKNSNPTIVQATKKVMTKQVAVTKTQSPKQDALAPENRIPASINNKNNVIPLLYTVQIGSYSTPIEAEKITQELQAKGFKTSFVPANINGQTWYRVNVGLFGTIKEAQDYKKEFLIKTKLSSAIVQRVLQ